MSKSAKGSNGDSKSNQASGVQTGKALVFVSHDTRDAAIAEAFSTLLSSVTCGMLKSFRSSDKSGKQGLEYGSEWYPEIMKNLEQASDVVCLLTHHSLGRPWILYEAGVAKGKLETPVHGLALGVPLSQAATGPFAQFQNCDDDVESISKLVMQLARRLPNADPQKSIVDLQVAEFSKKLTEILKTAGQPAQATKKGSDDSSAAKLFEEVKVMFQELPTRMEERITNAVRPSSRKRLRRFHPRMVEEMMHMGGINENDPIGILLVASMVRDEMPWFYEVARETYSALKSGDIENAEREMHRLRRTTELMLHGPFTEEFGDKESHMLMMEFSHMVDHFVHRFVARAPTPAPRKRQKLDADT
jgi:hypothetical protein